MKRAVILFNLGGPDKLESVEPFLFNLFNDPAIISIPSIIRYPLAKIISKRRTPIAKDIYKEIGNRSPILELTQKQSESLENNLIKGPPIKSAINNDVKKIISFEKINENCLLIEDILEEEIGDDVDTIVGISINGIAFAQAIGGQLDLDLAVSRSISEDGGGHISEVFADVEGKRCVVVDDVLSGGTTMTKTVNNLRAAGAEVKLCMVLANKSHRNEIEGVPLRGLVRVVTV